MERILTADFFTVDSSTVIPRQGFSAMWCWFTAQENKTERLRSMFRSPTGFSLQSLRNLRTSSFVMPLMAFRFSAGSQRSKRRQRFPKSARYCGALAFALLRKGSSMA